MQPKLTLILQCVIASLVKTKIDAYYTLLIGREALEMAIMVRSENSFHCFNKRFIVTGKKRKMCHTLPVESYLESNDGKDPFPRGVVGVLMCILIFNESLPVSSRSSRFWAS